MQGEQLMDLDGYEKGYAHGWRDGRAETPDRPEPIDEALEAFFEDIDADWSNDNLRPGTFAFRFRRAADRLRLAAYRTEPGETNA